MALPDLTGQNIQDTYQRVLQIGTGGTVFDGTGSLPPVLQVTASHAISASVEITHEVSSSHAQTADSASYVLAANIDQPFGNILSTGEISASNFKIPGLTISDQILSLVDEVRFVGGSKIQGTGNGIEIVESLYGNDDRNLFLGNLTASAAISASGNIYASEFYVNNREALSPSSGDANKLSINQGGQFTSIGIGRGNTTVPVTVFGDLTVTDVTNPAAGHITASGVISASGNTFGNIVDGQTFSIKGEGVIERNTNDIVLAGHSDFTKIQIGKQNQLKPLTLEGNVTASGDISASGKVYGEEFHIFGKQLAIYHPSSDAILIGQDGQSINVQSSTPTFLNPITASGDISSSGVVEASRVDISGKRLFYDSTNDWIEFKDTGVSIEGGVLTVSNNGNGHITASGNISASGNIIATNIDAIGGDISITDAGKFIFSVDNDTYLSALGNNNQIHVYGNSQQIAKFATSLPEQFYVSGHVSASGNIITEGNITASGDISSSGQGIFDTIDVKSSITGSYPKLTDSAGDTIFKISGVVQANTGKLEMGDVDNAMSGEVLILDNNGDSPLFYNSANASIKWGINNNPQNSVIGLTVAGDISSSGDLYVGGSYQTGSTPGFNFIGLVTASGDISASGVILSSNISSLTTTTGSLLNSINTISIVTGSYAITGSDVTFNHITASGNISGSATSVLTIPEIKGIGDSTGLEVGGYISSSELYVGDTTNFVSASLGNLNVSGIIASSNISSLTTTTGSLLNSVDLISATTGSLLNSVDLISATTGSLLNSVDLISATTGSLLNSVNAISIVTGSYAVTGSNVEFGSGSFDYIVARGESTDPPDTFIRLANDAVEYFVGGQKFLTMFEYGSNSFYGINSDQEDINFNIRGNSDANLFRTDAGEDAVAIGSNTYTSKFSVNGNTHLGGHITASGDISGSSGNILGFTSASITYITASRIDVDGDTIKIGGETFNKTLLQNVKDGFSSETRATSPGANKAFLGGSNGNDEFIAITPGDFVLSAQTNRGHALATADEGGQAQMVEGSNVYALKVIPKGFTATSASLFGNDTGNVVKWYSSSISVGTTDLVSTDIIEAATGTGSAFTPAIVGDGSTYVICEWDMTDTGDFVYGGKIYIERT
jgi:hypothetical protein